jgi:threonine dehydratase
MGTVTLAPGINEIRPATVQIRGLVRRTPLLAAAPTEEHPHVVQGLLLKLEALQVTGSLKPRGAITALLAMPSSRLQRGIVTAPGGNQGLAVACADRRVRRPCTRASPQADSLS